MNVVVVRHHPTGGLFCSPYFLLSLFMILLLSLSGKCRICIFFLSIPLYQHLDISRAITAESLPLHIALVSEYYMSQSTKLRAFNSNIS